MKAKPKEKKNQQPPKFMYAEELRQKESIKTICTNVKTEATKLLHHQTLLCKSFFDNFEPPSFGPHPHTLARIRFADRHKKRTKNHNPNCCILQSIMTSQRFHYKNVFLLAFSDLTLTVAVSMEQHTLTLHYMLFIFSFLFRFFSSFFFYTLELTNSPIPVARTKISGERFVSRGCNTKK